ncbi:MAG TPA: AEC family transporter [Henriciella marina]|uniref:AEC family transporter n=1 Tax=Henriciella sp. TaxID=1968823 RepID=UPI0017F90505|nr:AEC family transporter [Henriciella sp.]HIG21469.1 AEC family transporter [Henriciella sp.]HIK64382.1 AEC family transporter [Henriciella marina]
MSAFLSALVPVILIVALGRFLGWRKTITNDGWRAIERLAYVVLFPALIIRALANAPFEEAPWALMALLIAAQCVLGAFGLLARRWPGIQRPEVGSIIQSNVRWNTFVALSIASALFGDEGLALVSIAAAAMIPAANVLSVAALTSHAEREGLPKRNPVKELLRNPLIIACAIGGLLAALSIEIHPLLDLTIDLLGQGTIALGLLAAGAGMDIAALGRSGVKTVTWSMVRLLGLPVLAIGGALLLGISGTPLAIAVISASVPTATSSYILARQLGGDAPLAANLIAMQTVLSLITMPVIWFACLSFGLF